MRSNTRPLAYHLSWLVVASLVPTAWLAAALAASAFDPAWPSALALVTGVLAMVIGGFVSVLIARALRRTLDDLAAEATMLSRGNAVVRIEPTVREFAAIADALMEAASRVRGARTEAAASGDARGEFHWDIGTGVMEWSADAGALLDVQPGAKPSSALLLARVHPSDRALLANWLASLARGEAAEPVEFRVLHSDGATRAVRTHGTAELGSGGTASRIVGRFESAGAVEPAPRATRPPVQVSGRLLDASAVLQRVVAAARAHAAQAGIAIAQDAAPDLEPVHGDEGALEAALASLLDNAVTFTPRGGRIVLRAGWDADGDLRIVLGALGPATVTGALAVDGMGIAGNMVELNCGARSAMSIAEARFQIEPWGGRLLVSRATVQGDSVTIILPGARTRRAAA